MARRPLSDKTIRSLTKAAGGRSYTVTIPLEYITQLKWRAKQKLNVTLLGSKIIIKDWKK